MSPRARIAVVVGTRGRGSNLTAILDACKEPDFPGSVHVVVAPSSDTPAAEIAKGANCELRVVPREPQESYGHRMVEALSDADLVCLAGYMWLLPNEVLREHPQRVLNIHPSLLPRHGGKGMFGIKVQASVLAAGDAMAGCTVHHVSERYDEGAIVLQRSCAVLSDDSAEALAQRVLGLEHEAYPAAIRKVLSDG